MLAIAILTIFTSYILTFNIFQKGIMWMHFGGLCIAHVKWPAMVSQ